MIPKGSSKIGLTLAEMRLQQLLGVQQMIAQRRLGAKGKFWAVLCVLATLREN